MPGDVALRLHPLPTIALVVIAHLPDEDCAAGVICLHSANADRYLPLDALADVGEYTSQALIDRLREDDPR